MMQAQPKILIIEDQSADAYLMKQKISELLDSSTSLNVGTIAEASAVLNDHKFDVIMLDLNLPDSFGPKSVEDIRQVNATTPIIVTTGMVSELTVQECLRLGANNVVSKSSLAGEDFENILEQNLAS